MVGPARALFDRLGPWPAFVGFAGIGCATRGVALVSLVPLARAIGAGAPLVTLAPRDSIGLPIGLSFFAFAAITLSPRPNAAGRRRTAQDRTRGRFDWPVLCLWVVVAGIALTFASAWITETVVRASVERRGYVACPVLDDERPARLRWARAVAGTTRPSCPPTWREAARLDR